MSQETTANTSLCSFKHTKHTSGDVVNFEASFPFFFFVSENVFANPCSMTSVQRALHALRFLINLLQQILMDGSNEQ